MKDTIKFTFRVIGTALVGALIGVIVGTPIGFFLLKTGMLDSLADSTKSSYSKFIATVNPTKTPPSSTALPQYLQQKPPTGGVQSSVEEIETVVLNQSNTLVFRGTVTSEKVASLQIQAMKMSAKLDASETIYLVLDTPGGSVDAGNQFIDTLHSLPQQVKTLTVFAASMGFQMVQNLDERLVVPSGTLMSHRARAGFKGEVPGEALVQLNHLLRMLERLDQAAADRMGMKIEAYRDLIRDEYWVDGIDAVAQKAADRVVHARCDSSFEGTTNELLGSFMGIPVYGVMSRCPVITGILGISLGGDQSTVSVETKANAVEYGWSFRDRKQMARRTTNQ